VTTTPRSLQTLAVPSQLFAVSKTAQSFHPYNLTDLANDAAGGHVAQRATVTRSTGGIFVLFYDPRSAARYLSLALTVSWRGLWSPFDVVTVDIAIADQGAGALASSSTTIPYGLKGAFAHRAGNNVDRASSMARTEYILDVVDMAAAGSLSTAEPWTITLTVVCGATVYAELIELAEVPRLAIDTTADAYGEAPSDYVPRTPIDAGLSRLGATLAAAYDLNLRTYQHLALARADALTVTSATYAVIPGVQSETIGVATKWVIPPRRIAGVTSAAVGVHYRTSGASDGYLRATTGMGNLDTTLPGTSGVWTSVIAGGLAGLIDAATDTISWAAKVDGGTTLSLATFWLADAAP